MSRRRNKKRKLNKELRELEAQEHRLEKVLATAVANLESLDDDKAHDKRRRDNLKERKDEGRKYDPAELKRLNEEVRKANRRLAEVRKNIRRRKGWLKNTRIALRRKRRRLRNLIFRPKIIDLNLKFRPMAVQGSVNKVIGHYTAGPVDRGTNDAIRLCRLYHQAHLNRGWSGEAYMINFTRDGDILVLRPARYVGAHTLGYNTGSYGVMCHGTTGNRPSKAQKRAMRWWAKHGHEARMGDARTATQPKRLRWYGHNQFGATGCPGSFLKTYQTKGRA